MQNILSSHMEGGFTNKQLRSTGLVQPKTRGSYTKIYIAQPKHNWGMYINEEKLYLHWPNKCKYRVSCASVFSILPTMEN